MGCPRRTPKKCLNLNRFARRTSDGSEPFFQCDFQTFSLFSMIFDRFIAKSTSAADGTIISINLTLDVPCGLSSFHIVYPFLSPIILAPKERKRKRKGQEICWCGKWRDNSYNYFGPENNNMTVYATKNACNTAIYLIQGLHQANIWNFIYYIKQKTVQRPHWALRKIRRSIVSFLILYIYIYFSCDYK